MTGRRSGSPVAQRSPRAATDGLRLQVPRLRRAQNRADEGTRQGHGKRARRAVVAQELRPAARKPVVGADAPASRAEAPDPVGPAAPRCPPTPTSALMMRDAEARTAFDNDHEVCDIRLGHARRSSRWTCRPRPWTLVKWVERLVPGGWNQRMWTPAENREPTRFPLSGGGEDELRTALAARRMPGRELKMEEQLPPADVGAAQCQMLAVFPEHPHDRVSRADRHGVHHAREALTGRGDRRRAPVVLLQLSRRTLVSPLAHVCCCPESRGCPTLETTVSGFSAALDRVFRISPPRTRAQSWRRARRREDSPMSRLHSGATRFSNRTNSASRRLVPLGQPGQ